MRRIVFILLSAMVLTSLILLPSSAQSTVPDAGVRGIGIIQISNSGIGTLDINIAKSEDVIFGGFKYWASDADGIRRNYIYSLAVTEFSVVGNQATVQAVGYWNGMLSDLTVQVTDGSPDWYRVSAGPRGWLPYVYEQEGWLIKGDLAVFTNAQADAWAKGEGEIEARNIAKFRFFAEKTGNVVKGSVNYVELSPSSTSVLERAKISIYLPEVKTLEVDSTGRRAILTGPGTLNGRPARIEVEVKDNNSGSLPVQDEFYIRAFSLNTNSVTKVSYEAGGSLKSGNIEVGVK